MDKIITKALFAGFDDLMHSRTHDFVKSKKSNQPKWNGILYESHRPDFTHFVLIQLHDSNQTFTVELAGSITRTFPWRAAGSYTAWAKSNRPFYEARTRIPPHRYYRFRLAGFWEPSKDPWWHVTSIQEPDVDDNDAWHKWIFEGPGEIKPDLLHASLQDVAAKLKAYAFPYIEAIDAAASKHGTVPVPEGF